MSFGRMRRQPYGRNKPEIEPHENDPHILDTDPVYGKDPADVEVVEKQGPANLMWTFPAHTTVDEFGFVVTEDGEPLFPETETPGDQSRISWRSRAR